jgi:hypothetical protein
VHARTESWFCEKNMRGFKCMSKNSEGNMVFGPVSEN